MSMPKSSDDEQVNSVLISMVNQLLEVYHIPKKILHWWEIDSTILITIYRAVFCKEITGVVSSRSKSDEIHNINRLVATLENEFRDELHHISGEGIVRGNKVMLMNLLDIFKYMMEYVLEDIRSVSSGSENGDYDRYSPTYDPDMVTPEVIDDILERELSRNLSAGYNSSASQHRSRSQPATQHTDQLTASSRMDKWKADTKRSSSIRVPPASRATLWQQEKGTGQAAKEGGRSQDSTRNHTHSRFYSPELTGSTRELIALGQDASKSLSPLRSSNNNTDELIALGNSKNYHQSPPTKDTPGKTSLNADGRGAVSPGSDGVLVEQRLSDAYVSSHSHSPTKTASLLSNSHLTTDYTRSPKNQRESQLSQSPHLSDDYLGLPLPSTATGAAGRGAAQQQEPHSFQLSRNGEAVTSMSASAPVGSCITSSVGQQPHPSTTSRTDPELEAILSQNPIMASTGKSRPGADSTRQTDTYFEDKLCARSNVNSGPAKSRSFDNFNSLIEDTAAMAQRAVSRSPLREEHLQPEGGNLVENGAKRRKGKPAAHPQNTNVAAWLESTSAGTSARGNQDHPPPVLVADQLAPPHQADRGPATYEEYLRKYYGSTVRPRDESEEEDNVSVHSDSMFDYGDREVTTNEDSHRESKKSVRFRLQEEKVPLKATAKQGYSLGNIRSQAHDARNKQAYVDQLYRWELDDFREGMGEHMSRERSQARERDQEYQKKVLRKPKTLSNRPSAKYGATKRSRPKVRSVVKPRRRSVSSSPTVGTRRPLELSEDNLLPILLEEFPYLHLSRETLHDMWRKSMRQIELSTKAGKETQRFNKIQNQIEETERRHKVLADIMKKEVQHINRMREVKERQRAQRSVQAKLREKRQQSARARRYYDEYQVRMRAKMLKKRTKEEMIFKKLFQEGLDIHRERAREMRRYAREQREKKANVTQDQIASIENYYRDQYEMLAEAISKEKQDLNIKEKAQSKVLQEMAREFRKKMEAEIKSLQEQIYRDEDEEYWRQLDADRLRHSLQLAKVNAKVTT